MKERFALSPMTLTRRCFVASGLAALAGSAFPNGNAASAADPQTNPVAAPFDHEVEAFMKARQIPGGALAVVKDRRLVYARHVC